MCANLKPVTVVITCAIRPGKMAFAKKALNAVIKTVIKKEKDCRGIQVYDDPKNTLRLLIIEKWASEEIFLGPHMQTPHMIAFMKVAESFVDGKAEFTFWNEIGNKA
ncbi:antibiotic biosynthesis monooxygenase [Mucilaginibacter terrigena]|uniref:Antibiotic biosynthesis monooxygenase n=1 Tax=Mucilaginibacter terrigena TaxID=2492395 RepID=A0A4Q5LS06_9SPHI|nr:antibiotic biosynthesis monooxygenase [Mucilaginibacter terrigena]RYU92163.1 antibiotic biosynthesis monooxygenase [Mucilaginibacter terrigena]